MTDIKKDDEYRLLHAKPTIVKAADVFALVWILAVVVPVVWYGCAHRNDFKEYAVVKSVAVADDFLAQQYDAFSDKALDKVDISKYVNKIDVPKIKLDKADDLSEKVQNSNLKLAKLGLKGVKKVGDAAASLKKQVDKINDELLEKTKNVKASLNKEVRDGLKKEVRELASGQVKKQLALSDKAYKNLTENKFGWKGDKEKAATKNIYAELKNNKKGVFYKPVRAVEKYALTVFCVLLATGLVLLLIPPFIVVKIAKKVAKTYTQCPYCKKIYITKANAFNLLKLVKFW